MNKEEILKKAQNDNKGMDVADINIQYKAAYISYFIGVIGIIIVNIINGIVFGSVNHAPNMVISLMLGVAFWVKYYNLKKKHELIVALCYSLLTVMFLVFWILQLVKVW